MKTTNWDKGFRYALASLITAGFFLVLLFLVKYAIPTENKDLIYIVIGALIGAFGTIVNYEWGSSRSSAEKNELIGKKDIPQIPQIPQEPQIPQIPQEQQS